MMQQFRKLRLTYAFCLNYQSEARAIINRAYIQLRKPQPPLPILQQFFTEIWKAKLGISSNQPLFLALLDDSLPKIQKEIESFNQQPSQQTAEQLYSIFKNVLELQISMGIPYLKEWILTPQTYQIFQKIKAPIIYLKFVNLLGIHQQVHQQLEAIVLQFKRNTPSSYEDRLQFYQAIIQWRLPTEDELMHIKSTILDLSLLEANTMAKSIAFQQIIAEYIDLICFLFFEDNCFIDQDDEFDQKDDITMLLPLQRLLRLIQQQDTIWYKHEISLRTEDIDMKPGLIDLVDPIKWSQIKSIAKGVYLLAQFNQFDKSSIDMLENVVFRKLESDTVHISEGVFIFHCLMEFTPDVRKGKALMIMKSICDQINHSDYASVSLGNLSRLLEGIFVSLEIATSYENHFLLPALKTLTQWVHQGLFDQTMGKVDWFDVQEITQQFKYIEMKEYIQNKLNE